MSRKQTTSRASRVKLLAEFPIDQLKNEEGALPGWSHRIAHFLDWWAQTMPYDFVGYNEILKAVENRQSMPRMDSKDVEQLRARMYSAKKKLRAEYGRDTVMMRSMGVRATVDDKDVLLNIAPRQTIAVERSIKRLAETDAMIDLRRIDDNAETRAHKRWYNRSVRGILKQIAAPEFTDKLLPPKPGDAD